MTLKVVDVASYQSVTASTDVGAEGIIVKATQGTGYVNPLCDQQYQHAKKHGLKLGVYHYAGGGNPVAEADYFLRNIQGYIHEAILVLDWEKNQNAQYTNPNWARQFVNRVHEKTGVWCLIYGNSADIQYCASCRDVCGLWFAGYPDLRDNWNPPAFPYSTKPWPSMVGWQYSTSNSRLDRNIFYLTKEQWDKYANPGKTPTPPKPNPTTTKKPAPGPYVPAKGKSLEVMAGDVQAGKVGDGQKRRDILGKYWRGVQAIIDERSKAITAQQCHAILLDETWNGNYGNGEERKVLLGTYYNTIQDMLNKR